MGRPGGGGLLTPQAEGATWRGGAPHGGFPVGSAWALGGALTHSGHRSLASPPPPRPVLPVGDCGRGRELGEGPSACPEGSRGRSPLHSTFGPRVLPVQVARRSPDSRANTPGTPEHMRVCTRAHTHAHTHTRDVACPSVHLFQVLGPGRRDPVGPGDHGMPAAARWAGVCSHIDGGSAGWPQPFTSASPRCRVGPGAAGRERTRSRPPRSQSWGCPGRLASTARRAPIGPGTPAGGRRAAVSAAPPHGSHRGAGRGGAGPLTSVDVTVSTRSRSSTSCLKVGLCEGAACQHSRMIMYLGDTQVGPALCSPAPRPRGWPPPPQRTHRSCVQLAGLSMRWPSFSSLKSSSTGMPGYGEPPSVKISQRRTPKDQLWVVGGAAASAPEQTPPERRAQPRGLPPRPPGCLPPAACPPLPAHAPAKFGATYTSLWWV